MMSMMGWGMVLNMIFWILIVGLVIYAVLRMVFKEAGAGKKISNFIISSNNHHGLNKPLVYT